MTLHEHAGAFSTPGFWPRWSYNGRSICWQIPSNSDHLKILSRAFRGSLFLPDVSLTFLRRFQLVQLLCAVALLPWFFAVTDHWQSCIGIICIRPTVERPRNKVRARALDKATLAKSCKASRLRSSLSSISLRISSQIAVNSVPETGSRETLASKMNIKVEDVAALYCILFLKLVAVTLQMNLSACAQMTKVWLGLVILVVPCCSYWKSARQSNYK